MILTAGGGDGLGPVPGAAEHSIEHRECRVSLLEIPVLQTGTPLVLSFIPHMLTADATNEICALLFSRPAWYTSGVQRVQL